VTPPRQLELFAGLETAARSEPKPPPRPEASRVASADELARRLGTLLDGGLKELVLTDNKSRIVSARGNAAALEVRIHRSFVHATDATLARVAEFLRGVRGPARQRALAAIREHFEAHHQGAAPRRKARSRRDLETAGRHFDLAQILDELDRRFFDGRLGLAVTWGRRPAPAGGSGFFRRRKKKRSSIRLGSYHQEERLVRVHRALDRAFVPRYVVEAVVYHEMLHAVVPPVKRGTRRSIHPPEFRRREREFPHHAEAERWLAENLDRLLAAT
jgi:hypothetical protein